MSESKNESGVAVSHEPKAGKPRRVDVDAADATPAATPAAMEYDYTNFYFGAGDDAFALLEPFDDWWREVKPAGYYLYELPLHTAPGTRVDVEDTKTGEIRRGLVNFASYNYLGLSYREEVKQAIKEAADIYGGGSSGSPILSGTTALHRQFAEEVAAFKGTEVFPLQFFAAGAPVHVVRGSQKPAERPLSLPRHDQPFLVNCRYGARGVRPLPSLDDAILLKQLGGGLVEAAKGDAVRADVLLVILARFLDSPAGGQRTSQRRHNAFLLRYIFLELFL